MAMEKILRSALPILSILVVLSITGYGTWVSWPYVLSYGRSLPSTGFEAAIIWIPITALAVVVALGGGFMWLCEIQSIFEDLTDSFHILRLPAIIFRVIGCGVLGTVVLYAFLMMG